jgi:hypothetical protein
MERTALLLMLSHVNKKTALRKGKPVHANWNIILMKGKAIIDYYNQYLYLRKKP